MTPQSKCLRLVDNPLLSLFQDLYRSLSVETALTQSSMIGSKEFTATLEKLANG